MSEPTPVPVNTAKSLGCAQPLICEEKWKQVFRRLDKNDENEVKRLEEIGGIREAMVAIQSVNEQLLRVIYELKNEQRELWTSIREKQQDQPQAETTTVVNEQAFLNTDGGKQVPKLILIFAMAILIALVGTNPGIQALVVHIFK